MEKINKKMNIKEIIDKYPKTLDVFNKFNFHCLGCAMSQYETLEDGALAHNIDVDKLVKALNKIVKD